VIIRIGKKKKKKKKKVAKSGEVWEEEDGYIVHDGVPGKIGLVRKETKG
jgi:hypothetical protein